jgi:transcriptional regulator with XRE-family HTH domain
MAQRQLTQAELAQRIGVGQSAISMLLKRRCRPQRKTLGKLATTLGVEVEALWAGFREPWDLRAVELEQGTLCVFRSPLKKEL